MEEAFDEYFPSEGPDKEWGRGRGPGCFPWEFVEEFGFSIVRLVVIDWDIHIYM